MMLRAGSVSDGAQTVAHASGSLAIRFATNRTASDIPVVSPEWIPALGKRFENELKDALKMLAP